MNVDILYRPSYSMARVRLERGETIFAEAGAMVGLSSNIKIDTRLRGGVFKAFARSVLAEESLFINAYTAPEWGGEVLLAPALPGDIWKITLNDESYLVQSGSFLASSEGVQIDTKWSGARTFFAGESFIMLRCHGSGLLLVSSYGAIHEIDLVFGEVYTVDTGHLVAFRDGMGFRVRPVGGLKSTLASGEGLVVDLTGPGKVLIQTRSEDVFLEWLLSKMPGKNSESS